MKVDLDIRGGGKTWRSIVWSHQTGAVIVCPTRQRAVEVAEMAKKMKILIPPPICTSELQGLFWGRKIIIEDLDQMLPKFYKGFYIERVTMTEEGYAVKWDAHKYNPDDDTDEWTATRMVDMMLKPLKRDPK